MHWHLFPRRNDDPMMDQPIWIIDKSIRNAENTKPATEEIQVLKEKLLLYL